MAASAIALLAAVEAGAEQVHVTVNGIGEPKLARYGEQVLAALGEGTS